MKISFPKYGPGGLFTKRGARFIISSVIIGFLAGVVGSYLLENHFWLLTIAVLSIASILVCLGAAVGIFLNWNKVDGAPSANIKENLPRITSQWQYRPRKPIQAQAAFDSAGAEASEALTPEHFAINNDVWLNNDSLEAHTFVDVDPTVGDVTTKALSSAHERAVSTYD